MFDPASRIAGSVFTNAIDGPAAELLIGAMKLIQLTAAVPASPVSEVTAARFCGRFASMWSIMDVVDAGGRLVAVSPTMADPVFAIAELEVLDDDSLRVVGGSGYGSIGEHWHWIRDDDGAVVSLRAGSSMSMWPIADYLARPLPR